MTKILAFGSSNSKKSINKKFATYVANKLENVEVTIADLNDVNLPLFSPDLLEEEGVPDAAIQFDALVKSVDAIVLSLAEYNGNHPAVFKNLWDWVSKVDGMEVWRHKPMLLLATSPGKRGASSVLKIMKDIMPFYGGNLIADFSLPQFYDNFTPEGIKDEALNADLESKIKLFQDKLNEES